MTGIIRNSLVKVRTKALSSLISKLDKLDAKITDLQDANGAIKAELQAYKNGPYSTISISDKEIVTKIFNGLKMYLDPTDIAVAPHLALDGIWEEAITRAWLSVQKPQAVIFDIGANFGYYGALAAQVINRKTSKVILFEANPHLLPYIRKTLSINWLNEACVVENLGVSDVAGEAKLTILKDYIGCSSLHSIDHLDKYLHEKMHLEAEETITVETISIDEYCKNNAITQIDLMKLDIEGYEQKAYEGMKHMIEESPKLTLFVEFTKESYDNPKAFYERMLTDFQNLYMIDQAGNIIRPKNVSYQKVVGSVEDWVMLIFSKQSLEIK